MVNREKLYDLLCNKADKLLKEYNPCRVNKDLFGGTYCQQFNDRDELCCGGQNGKCDYWSTTGCTTKCLACKLSLCRSDSRYNITTNAFNECCDEIHVNKIFRTKMLKLIKKAKKHHLIMIRSTKEMIFE